MKLKKGDHVVVVIGKDRGVKGKIERIFPKTKKILIPGVNIYKRHTRAQGEGKPGGIVDITKPMPATNVALICPKCGQKTRVGYQLSKNEKNRICKKCQAII